MPTNFDLSPTDMDPKSAHRTVNALVDLVQSHASLRSVQVLRLGVPPSVENRPGAHPQHALYADEARRSRCMGDSFTEAFLAAADRNDDLASALGVIDYHQRFDEAPFAATVARDDFTAEAIGALADGTPPGQMLVLTSKVQTDEGERHIPLLDFKVASTARNEDAARAVAQRLGGGLLVNSGSSYHLYGLNLLSADELFEWLLHAQLFSRCVDTRWVTHQLIERCAALRLSRGGSRNLHPHLVDKILPPGS